MLDPTFYPLLRGVIKGVKETHLFGIAFKKLFCHLSGMLSEWFEIGAYFFYSHHQGVSIVFLKGKWYAISAFNFLVISLCDVDETSDRGAVEMMVPFSNERHKNLQSIFRLNLREYKTRRP